MLRNGALVRVSSVARELDISASTAHRILSMLVFHGFAVQDAQRHYLPGPALGAPVLIAQDVDKLLALAAPVLEGLAEAVHETVNLTLRVGPHTRVLVAVGTQGMAEMDRTGAVLPAHATAAGRALLTHVSQGQLEHLFRGQAAERAGVALSEHEFAELERELNRTRIRNYALSRREAIEKLSAVAVPVTVAANRSISIAIITPDARLDALVTDEARMSRLYQTARVLGGQLETDAVH